MAKFRNVKQAFKKGYKIYHINYDINDQEWYIRMKGINEFTGSYSDVYFFLKKLPKYLTAEMLHKEVHKITCENFSFIETTIAILKNK